MARNSSEVLDELADILGDEFNPLLCKARNAIALQKIADSQIKATIRGKVVVKHERAKMVTYVNAANYAFESLIKYVVEDKKDLVGSLLDALNKSALENKEPPTEKETEE